jgi:thiamine biosynthesis protein ThiS
MAASSRLRDSITRRFNHVIRAGQAMQVQVNGETRQLGDGMTVADLVADMGMAGRRIAVEVNLEIVPRSRHAGHALQDGDRVEIVQAIGGG